MTKPLPFFLVLTAAVALAASSGAFGARSRTLDPGQWRTWWGQVSFKAGAWTLRSTAPTSSEETHSALVTSPPSAGDQGLSFTATTIQQLRTGSAPNPWEVGWAMFRFRDLENYYWFILKPNGYELGKKQGSDTQVFLATGTSPRLQLNHSNRIEIRAEGSRIRVAVDGVPVVDYTDAHPLPSGGSVGLYEEDARVRFESVQLSPL